MDENRLSGTAKNIGGKLEEGFGQVTGDTKIEAEGIARQSAELPKTCMAKHVTPHPT
jgi:uncharacterized protein YjbJ (UPF0337 family)